MEEAFAGLENMFGNRMEDCVNETRLAEELAPISSFTAVANISISNLCCSAAPIKTTKRGNSRASNKEKTRERL